MADTPARPTVEFQLLRYRPEQDDAPVWQSFAVPYSEDMSVLQALQQIKDEQDGSLSYRWSCRMAICGSCGMMINGKPALSCKTFVRDLLPGPVRVEALAHFPIEKDLVVQVDGFVEKLARIKPYIIPRAPRTLAEGEYLQTPEQLEKIEQFSSCINCMLCYAACPQYGLVPTSAAPACSPCSTATTPIPAMAARLNAWPCSAPPTKACGTAPPWATAPKSVPRGWTRPTR